MRTSDCEVVRSRCEIAESVTGWSQRTIDVALRSACFGVLSLLTGCATDHVLVRSAALGGTLASAESGPAEDDNPDQPRDVRGQMRLAGSAAVSEVPRYGLLHAHTYFSDGSGTPTQAFARARSKGVDFFAVTPHNHSKAEMGAKERTDGVLIATTPSLYNATTPVTVTRELANGTNRTVTVSSLISAAKQSTTLSFIALYGQEFSTISSGNHVNVFGVPDVLTVANGDYEGLFEELDRLTRSGLAAPVVQLNHPSVSKDLFSKSADNKFNDYGFDDYGEDFKKLVDASDRYVALIEILSGPAMNQSSLARYSYSREQHERDYYYYLCQGFHISPSVGHDNHYPTWGDATPARMGVWTSDRTSAGLYRAMHENRTFATEDPELRVQLTIDGQQMGSTLTKPAGSTLQLWVSVTDPEEDSDYEVVLIHGVVKPQTKATLEKLHPDDGEVDRVLATGGTVDLNPRTVGPEPEFYYIRVKQKSDGDVAWSAPIWINHARRD